MRFRQSQVDSGEGLALGGRWAADDDSMQRLQRLQMVQTGTQSPEFFRRGFMRMLQIEQVRLGRWVEGYLRDVFQYGRVQAANGLLDNQPRQPIFGGRRRTRLGGLLMELIRDWLRSGITVSVLPA